MLVFLVVIPETVPWHSPGTLAFLHQDWAGHTAFVDSKFKKWCLSLPGGSHFYQVGNQHLNRQFYPASRSSSVFFLASQPTKSKLLRQKIAEAFQRPASLRSSGEKALATWPFISLHIFSFRNKIHVINRHCRLPKPWL